MISKCPRCGSRNTKAKNRVSCVAKVEFQHHGSQEVTDKGPLKASPSAVYCAVCGHPRRDLKVVAREDPAGRMVLRVARVTA